MNKFQWTHHVEYESNVCAVWLRDEFKKWSYQMSAALPSQKSWVWIPLKTPEIFQVHTYKTIAEIVQQVRGSLIFLNSYAEYVDQSEIHDVNLICFLTAFVTNVDVINESTQFKLIYKSQYFINNFVPQSVFCNTGNFHAHIDHKVTCYCNTCKNLILA